VLLHSSSLPSFAGDFYAADDAFEFHALLHEFAFSKDVEVHLFTEFRQNYKMLANLKSNVILHSIDSMSTFCEKEIRVSQAGLSQADLG